MATKFKVWIDNPSQGTNIQSYADFVSDTQRLAGFSAGTVASSIRVNSVLRQANLVAVAFMDAILPNSELDLTSSPTSVRDEIKAVFSNLATKNDVKVVDDKLGTQVTYSLNGTTLSITTK